MERPRLSGKKRGDASHGIHRARTLTRSVSRGTGLWSVTLHLRTDPDIGRSDEGRMYFRPVREEESVTQGVGSRKTSLDDTEVERVEEVVKCRRIRRKVTSRTGWL